MQFSLCLKSFVFMHERKPEYSQRTRTISNHGSQISSTVGTLVSCRYDRKPVCPLRKRTNSNHDAPINYLLLVISISLDLKRPDRWHIVAKDVCSIVACRGQKCYWNLDVLANGNVYILYNVHLPNLKETNPSNLDGTQQIPQQAEVYLNEEVIKTKMREDLTLLKEM
ncbi:hypothetical protein FF38_08550 [Lucilia cuprina]|uniref:Uncharacterized protein n=1 Tax=Lucilia cuprina TaxID=7375 RepID=A0A0L0CCI5_LUCCU|nr:hypothetical protein FF38_08550 [Lucilia cuprina]